VELERRNGFFERAEDFGKISRRRRERGVCRGSGNGLEEEFVARSAGEAGIFAAGGEDARGGWAAVAPLKVNVLKKEVVGSDGRSRVGRSDEGAAGFGGGVSVDDKLEMAAGKSGVGIGVVGN
jgi:hypothetical protein